MSGVRIAALYGFRPFQLGLCGPQEKSAKRILFNFLSGEELLEKKVREILKQFKGAFPYYKLIAKCNDISDPFDEKVVRAYWIGNKFLNRVLIDSLQKMVANEFSKPGLLTKKIAEKKAREIPSNSKPHHSFHVLVIGSVTGTVSLKGKLLDFCRVGWGKILKIKNSRDRVLVEYQPLIIGKVLYPVRKPRPLGRLGLTISNGIYLGKPKKKWIFWNTKIVPKIKIGDWVSIHWNYLVEILNKKDLANLKKYTKLTLKSLNVKKI